MVLGSVGWKLNSQLGTKAILELDVHLRDCKLPFFLCRLEVQRLVNLLQEQGPHLDLIPLGEAVEAGSSDNRDIDTGTRGQPNRDTYVNNGERGFGCGMLGVILESAIWAVECVAFDSALERNIV